MRQSLKTVTRNKNSDKEKLVAELCSARRLAGLLSCCAQSRLGSERVEAAMRERQRRPFIKERVRKVGKATKQRKSCRVTDCLPWRPAAARRAAAYGKARARKTAPQTTEVRHSCPAPAQPEELK